MTQQQQSIVNELKKMAQNLNAREFNVSNDSDGYVTVEIIWQDYTRFYTKRF